MLREGFLEITTVFQISEVIHTCVLKRLPASFTASCETTSPSCSVYTCISGWGYSKLTSRHRRWVTLRTLSQHSSLTFLFHCSECQAKSPHTAGSQSSGVTDGRPMSWIQSHWIQDCHSYRLASTTSRYISCCVHLVCLSLTFIFIKFLSNIHMTDQCTLRWS